LLTAGERVQLDMEAAQELLERDHEGPTIIVRRESGA
jgi:hypothetical protein